MRANPAMGQSPEPGHPKEVLVARELVTPIAPAEMFFDLQDRQFRALATVLERYASKRGLTFAVPAFDLARVLIGATHGIALQGPTADGSAVSRAFELVGVLLRSFLTPVGLNTA